MRLAGLVLFIVVALGFDFTNGFHDAANAVATSITTRALRPLTALGMAAGLNMVGALVSTKVASTVGKGIISSPSGTHGLMVIILRVFRRARATVVNDRFRKAQTVSAAAMAFSHGTQDAQKTMGVITLALVTTGHLRSFHVPYWVIFSAAGAMGLGTLAGGWRVIRTLGRRITTLDPARGFATETAASAVLLVSAYAYAMPVSSTHIITSSIMGVG